LPSYSLAGGVDASYVVSAGKTTVVITSKDRLKHRGVQVGTGQMIFHWVQEGKTQAWRCEISMLDPVAAQAVETTGTDGGQRLEVELGNVYPAGCILQGNMVGTLMAPAVHVDVPFGSDVWAFLVRSPWFPLTLQIDKPVLAVEHDEGRATASLDVSGAEMVTAQVTLDGTGFKSASLVVRRTLGSYNSNEVICEVGPGTQAFEWKPIARLFDLLLVTRGSVSEKQVADVARGLGAQISSGILGVGSVQGDFVLCDGPATSYTWLLKGHSGFLENVEDQTAAKFTW
jgi:hypothetical protein